ncbi:MAG TPA: VgrG-related protein [Candidatus Limnocylindrales bacterium]
MPDPEVSIGRLIEIDGSKLADDIDGQLESATVVDRLAMPDMFALVFRDPGKDVLGRAGLEVGTKVKISTTSANEDMPKALIDAEVTSIESEYGSHGTLAVVRGYDRSHRLAAGRKTATYLNTKYSDIASQVAGAASLTADVDESEGTFDHVFQINQSDLDFLYGLARQIGYDCRVDGEKLLFKKPVESSSAPAEATGTSASATELVWGDNLLDFRARLSAVAQVSKVEVRGWDPKNKQEVIGTAEATATNAELPTTPGDLAGKIGGQTLVVVDHGVNNQQAADQLATARAEQIGSAAFEATAVAAGSPDLKAGVAVSIGGVDPALAGKWVVSGSRHEFGDGMYRTSLEFTGRQDRSLHGLLSHGGAADRINGVAVAIVSDNDDPEQAGRVRVSLPWLSADAVSDWARIAAPGAGKDSGVVWMPEVGDEVLVAFELGDLSRPIVVGGLWNGKDTIPFDYGSDLDAGSVTYRGFKSRTGHKISFRESSSDSSIELVTQGGAVTITLDDMNKQIKIETEGKLTIDVKQDVEIKAGGSMKLEATGQMTIKGATVAIN